MATRFEYHTPTALAYETAMPLSPGQFYIQVFKPAVTHALLYVKLKIQPDNIGETYTVTVKATDANGKPTGGDLTSGTYTAINTLLQDIQFNLAPQITVFANSRYALLITSDNGGNLYHSNSNLLLYYGEPFYYRGRSLQIHTGDPDYAFYGVTHPFKEYDEFGALFESHVAEGAITYTAYLNHLRFQSFTPRTLHNIKRADLFLQRFGGGTGTVTLRLRACTSDDIPTGSDLASGTIPDTDVPTGAPAWVTINLTAAYPLAVGSTYALCLDYDKTTPSSIKWATPTVWKSCYRLTDSPDRNDGAMGHSNNNGATWFKIDSDECLWFEEWGGPPFSGWAQII